MADAEPVDALDALLRQIVNGYFVLTDGQGSVSKWSEPAELLFDQPAEDILGQGFFETLIGGALPPAGQAWRGFLDTGEAPRVPGTRRARRPPRRRRATFPMEAVFVPVKLDEGFDFSLFLEDLAFELPMNLMLLRMRQQHPVVVRALQAGARARGAAVGGLAHRRHARRLPPAARDAVGRVRAGPPRGRARRADAETEERLTQLDPGIQGDVNDLDDAAAVVARLLSALERIDELERVAGGLPAQLEEARRDAEKRAPRPSVRPRRCAPTSSARSQPSRPSSTATSSSPAWSAWSAPRPTPRSQGRGRRGAPGRPPRSARA